MIDETAELDVGVLQVCDHPPIEEMSRPELAQLAEHARGRGVELELGTRGISPPHLMRYLELAENLGVKFVRSMLGFDSDPADNSESIELLSKTTAAYASQGVTLGLETYEQVPTRDLVAIVDAVDNQFLGICLDLANTVAMLEMPDMVLKACASRVVNVHVKDFKFTRSVGWLGFSLIGCALGTGLLPYDDIIAAVNPEERGVNLIVEHWVPPMGSVDEACRTEQEWTRHSVDYMRRRG